MTRQARGHRVRVMISEYRMPEHQPKMEGIVNLVRTPWPKPWKSEKVPAVWSAGARD